MDKGEKGASHPDGVPGKYEYPALDAEPGYWPDLAQISAAVMRPRVR